MTTTKGTILEQLTNENLKITIQATKDSTSIAIVCDSGSISKIFKTPFGSVKELFEMAAHLAAIQVQVLLGEPSISISSSKGLAQEQQANVAQGAIAQSARKDKIVKEQDTYMPPNPAVDGFDDENVSDLPAKQTRKQQIGAAVDKVVNKSAKTAQKTKAEESDGFDDSDTDDSGGF